MKIEPVEILEFISSWFLNTVIGIFFAVLGYFMSTAYTLACGWDEAIYQYVCRILPFATVGLFALYLLCENGKYSWKVVWIAFGYCLLPIFTFVTAVILHCLHLTVLASFVFRYRFFSLIVVPVCVFLWFVAYPDFRDFWNRRAKSNNESGQQIPDNDEW